MLALIDALGLKEEDGDPAEGLTLADGETEADGEMLALGLND